MAGAQSSTSDSDVALTPELQEEIRLARRCFTFIERLSTLMASYPASHPIIEKGVDALQDAFAEYFELNDRLSVQIFPHWMELSGVNAVVWETAPPKDYCFSLCRDGLFLLHILAGVQGRELRRLVELLNDLVDERNVHSDAVAMLFEANFRYISYDAMDESLAALAGLDSDIRNRDTREEQELIEELFQKAYDSAYQASAGSGEQKSVLDDFEVRLKMQVHRYEKLDLGSRHFLALTPETQKKLSEIKVGLTDHSQLEHRQGEVLSAMLSAKPKPGLRRLAVEQIGQVLGLMVETEAPWESLSLLKLVHQWRDQFDDEVTDELKSAIRRAFTPRRTQSLIKDLSTSDQTTRRAILQMFHALHLDDASRDLVQLLGWEIDEDARDDIVRYLRERSKYDLSFFKGSITQLPLANAEPLVDILMLRMPYSRPILLHILRSPAPAPLKLKALESLHGTWENVREIRQALVPLVDSSNAAIRQLALRSFAMATPQHVERALAPNLEEKLRTRSDEEVREMVEIFVKHGGKDALEHLKSIIHRRGVVNEEQKELAVKVIRTLFRTPNDDIVNLLETVQKDWLVPGRIREVCKEALNLIRAHTRHKG